MNKKNVLIFPGGTEIGLEIWRSLKYSKHLNLFSAGSNVSNHAPFVFKNHFIVPDVHEEGWIKAIAEVCEKNKIDYVFPAHDDVIVALAENTEKFHAKIVASPLETCLITRSKTKTYEQLGDVLPVPKQYRSPSKVDFFPVFVKPDKGQGSLNAEKVCDLETLKNLTKNNPNLIILQYLNGKEYTVDCFSDRQRGLLFCQGRERIRIKNGISMSSKPVSEVTNKIFKNYADAISQKLVFYGAWFFQLKVAESGEFVLLEVAPRVSGTMAASRVIGVNFAELSIYESERANLVLIKKNCKVQIDRALTNRYLHNIKYDKIYVDLDDTLIINEKVNSELVKLLYENVNKGCKIILITKTVREGKIVNILKRFKLYEIFDEIISIKQNENKSDFIKPKNAIFIDDSFNERKAIFERFGIPTFDCSMIEMLFDEKI